MSTETPETKNPYQARREAVERAVKAWQQQAAEADEAGDREPTAFEDAGDLEDCLRDEGLILLPRSTGHGKWVAEVDGQRAPIAPGSDRPTGLLDAEDAAEVFLTVTAADELAAKKVTIRPATDMEVRLALAGHLFGGAA